MFQVHDYVSIKSEAEEIETEPKESEVVVIPSKVAEVVPEEVQTPQTLSVKTETDPEWQHPISLIELRKKLNKTFTNKYQFMQAKTMQ